MNDVTLDVKVDTSKMDEAIKKLGDTISEEMNKAIIEGCFGNDGDNLFTVNRRFSPFPTDPNTEYKIVANDDLEKSWITAATANDKYPIIASVAADGEYNRTEWKIEKLPSYQHPNKAEDRLLTLEQKVDKLLSAVEELTDNINEKFGFSGVLETGSLFENLLNQYREDIIQQKKSIATLKRASEYNEEDFFENPLHPFAEEWGLVDPDNRYAILYAWDNYHILGFADGVVELHDDLDDGIVRGHESLKVVSYDDDLEKQYITDDLTVLAEYHEEEKTWYRNFGSLEGKIGDHTRVDIAPFKEDRRYITPSVEIELDTPCATITEAVCYCGCSLEYVNGAYKCPECWKVYDDLGM